MREPKEFTVVLISFLDLDFGIRYISSFLKKRGYPVFLINVGPLKYPQEFISNDFFTRPFFSQEFYTGENLDIILELIKGLNPGLVGINVSSPMLDAAKTITCRIKQAMNVPVCWGGIHPIIAPEECINFNDLICVGEGEWPFFELAERLLENRDLEGIQGLWINKGRIVRKTEPRVLIEDLDSLPFPDFVDNGNKFTIFQGRIIKDAPIISGAMKNTYPIMTSRGCMFGCHFCCNSIIKQKYAGKGSYLRRRSVENVIQELRLAIANKPITRIKFWDDIFTYDKDWVDEFCRRYPNEIGKPFLCYAHPKFTDKQVITKLVRCGLYMVIMGIQSGSEEVNKRVYNRDYSNQGILHFLNAIKETMVMVRFDMILDNPYEGEAQLNEATELLLKLSRPYRMQFYSLCYFPKTPLTERALLDKIITTQELEQYTRKTLTNFFLYLPFSRDKKHFFWNCICCLSVNQKFPKWLVRFCKSNRLLKQHPRLLFIFAHFYLKTSRSLYIFSRKKIDVITNTRVLTFDSPLLTPASAKGSFMKSNLSLSLYPSENNETTKGFIFKIINSEKSRSKVTLYFSLFVLFSRKINCFARWKTNIEISEYETVIQIFLSYPDLYMVFDQEKKKAELIHQKNEQLNNNLLLFRVYIFDQMNRRQAPYLNQVVITI